MKKIETKKIKANALHDAAEADRLARIAEFEAYQFEPWLQTMSAASSLPKENVLQLLYYAGEHGIVLARWKQDGGFLYRHDRSFVGWLPMEIATDIFIADQWHRDKAIPDRWIYWNEKRTAQRAEIFKLTDQLARVK